MHDPNWLDVLTVVTATTTALATLVSAVSGLVKILSAKARYPDRARRPERRRHRRT